MIYTTQRCFVFVFKKERSKKKVKIVFLHRWDQKKMQIESRYWECVCVCVCYALNFENMYSEKMCKRLRPVQVRCSKYPLLLIVQQSVLSGPNKTTKLSSALPLLHPLPYTNLKNKTKQLWHCVCCKLNQRKQMNLILIWLLNDFVCLFSCSFWSRQCRHKVRYTEI